jgi:TetR/AcrR family transcriptional regulator, mexJK operon transcriptional repressor
MTADSKTQESKATAKAAAAKAQALVPSPLRGRPVDWDKRVAITQAARERFVRHGYEGLSLEAVAASAGVSKVTIYRAYMDRSGLLEAVVEMESQRMLAALDRLSIVQAPLTEQIFALALELLTHLSKSEARQFEQAMMLEGRRHPQLLARFFVAGPGRIRTVLSNLLQSHGWPAAKAQSLAEALMASWWGAIPLETQFGLAPPPEAAALAQRLQKVLARWDGILSAPPEKVEGNAGQNPLSPTS